MSLVALLLSQGAAAWGADGHQLVCQLAWDRLSEPARAFVAETLAMGEELDGNGENDLAAACLWPDAARFETYKGTYEEHFINVPRTARNIDFARDCAAMDCIAVGIQRSLTYLSRPAESRREEARKAAALRFLGHYMGDLYQPLHVGHGEDWGGNKISVTWFGEDSNLHRVWDSGILDRANITYPESLDVIAAVEVEQPPGVLEALQASFKLARSHAYANVGGRPVGMDAVLGDAYFERNKPVVIEQLARSAHHLTVLIEGLARGTLDTNILIE